MYGYTGFELEITAALKDGENELLGMDNGRTDDQTPYRSGSRETYGGLAYAILRAPHKPGQLMLTFTAPGLDHVTLTIPCK